MQRFRSSGWTGGMLAGSLRARKPVVDQCATSWFRRQKPRTMPRFYLPIHQLPLLNTPSMSSVFLLSSDYYDEAGHIYIHETSPSGLVFAKIAIEFLRKGGLNTWDFVLAITNMLVDPVLDCPGTIRTASGDLIDLTSIPSEGAFVYTQEGLLPS